MPVFLQPASGDDEDFLFRLYARTREEEVTAWGWGAAQRDTFLRMQFQAQRNSYKAAYPQADRNLIVADRVAIGCLLVNLPETGFAPADQVHLVDISILPEYRNQGIGTGLIRGLLHEAEVMARPLALQVARNNRAIGLYERLGFKLVSANEMYCQMIWHPDTKPGAKSKKQEASVLDKLDRQTFASQLHTNFKVTFPELPSLSLQLFEVAEGPLTSVVEQFSLLFHGSMDRVLQQGTFQIEHESLGGFPLFLVPIGPDSEGMRYQAVFSRLRGPQ